MKRSWILIVLTIISPCQFSLANGLLCSGLMESAHRARPRFESLDRESQKIWEDFYQNATNGNQAMFIKQIERLEQGLLEKDPHSLYLEKLGAFRSRQLPSAVKLVDIYETEIVKAANRSKVSTSDILWPARVMKLPNGDIVGVRIGFPVSEGAKLFHGVLSPKDFVNLLAQGLFPLGEGEAIATRLGTMSAKNTYLDQTVFGHDYFPPAPFAS